MPNHTLKASASNIQWAAPVLDGLIAPEFSTLSSFSIPEVAETPNYFGSFFLNNVFQFNFRDRARPLVFSMLRHLAQATKEYRIAGTALSDFGKVKQHGSDAISIYLRALTSFEHSVIHSDLAVGLSHAVVRCIDVNTPKKHFVPDQNTPEERLRHLSNALKHWNSTIVDGNLPERAAPMWIVAEGLRGVSEAKKGGAPIAQTLLFDELANILTGLDSNARFLAEEVYQLAAERRADKHK